MKSSNGTKIIHVNFKTVIDREKIFKVN